MGVAYLSCRITGDYFNFCIPNVTAHLQDFDLHCTSLGLTISVTHLDESITLHAKVKQAMRAAEGEENEHVGEGAAEGDGNEHVGEGGGRGGKQACR